MKFLARSPKFESGPLLWNKYGFFIKWKKLVREWVLFFGISPIVVMLCCYFNEKNIHIDPQALVKYFLLEEIEDFLIEQAEPLWKMVDFHVEFKFKSQELISDSYPPHSIHLGRSSPNIFFKNLMLNLKNNENDALFDEICKNKGRLKQNF